MLLVAPIAYRMYLYKRAEIARASITQSRSLQAPLLRYCFSLAIAKLQNCIKQNLDTFIDTRSLLSYCFILTFHAKSKLNLVKIQGNQ